MTQNLHEIRNEILRDYVGEFEMGGILKVGDQVRQTHIRFRNIDDYESINSIDEGYDAENSIFKGCIYKTTTPQFNEVKRSQYGNRWDLKQEIIEYRGNICFIPKKDIVLLSAIVS